MSSLVLKFFGCIALALVLYIAGIAWGEWKFAAGSLHGGLFVFVMGCFAVEWV